jgi:hypothetical protein
MDDETNDITPKPKDQVFYESNVDGKSTFIGWKKFEQYIIEHTEWSSNTEKSTEVTNSTPESIKNFRDWWVNGMKIGNKETRESHKAKLDQLAANGGVNFETYQWFNDVCHINIPWFDGRFYAPKITPNEKTKKYYHSTNYAEGWRWAWDNSNNRNDTYLKGMRDDKW